jgi:hypothetical protein
VGSDGCFAGHDLAFAKKESGTQQDVSSSFMMSGIPPTAAYLIGVPSIVLGSILFVGGIVGLIIGHDCSKKVCTGYARLPPLVALT